MMEKRGLMVQALADGTAEVITERQSACGGCENSGGCRACLSDNSSRRTVATVQNPVGARAGDVVLVRQLSGALWAGAGLVYGLPLVGLFIGAALGTAFGGLWELDASAAAPLLGLAGLALGFVVTFALSKWSRIQAGVTPRIVRIIERKTPVERKLESAPQEA